MTRKDLRKQYEVRTQTPICISLDEYAKWLENELINVIPEQKTPEFVNFLLNNALRGLTKEQFHSLVIALSERDLLKKGE